jgi:thiamine biosynthesis lipoprotein ApbE
MNDHEISQPMHQPIYDRRTPMPCSDHEKRLALTEQAVMSIKQTSEGMTTKLDLILAQITKVAILEEKHSNLLIDNDRAHSKIADVTDKLDKLAEESRGFMNYTKGQNKVLWAIGSVVLGLLIKALFFAANNGMTH